MNGHPISNTAYWQCARPAPRVSLLRAPVPIASVTRRQNTHTKMVGSSKCPETPIKIARRYPTVPRLHIDTSAGVASPRRRDGHQSPTQRLLCSVARSDRHIHTIQRFAHRGAAFRPPVVAHSPGTCRHDSREPKLSRRWLADNAPAGKSAPGACGQRLEQRAGGHKTRREH